MANRNDNFTRANSISTINPPSDGLGNYSGATGTAGITSNQGYFPTAPSAYCVRVLDCGSADAVTQITVNTGTNFVYTILAVRWTDDSNFDMMFSDGTTSQWYKVVSGSLTALGSSFSLSISAADVLKVDVEGTTYKTYHNGSLVNTQTLSSANNGTKHGIGVDGNSNILFSALSVTPAATSSIAFTDSAGTTITTLPSNHGAGTATIKAVATGFTFANPTSWSVSGVSGWSVSSSTFVDTTHYTVVLGCPAAASPPAGTTGTLTVTDSTDTVVNTLTITTPTLSSSPTHASAGSASTLTLTGNVQLWSDETASGLFTVSGGTSPSFATPTVSNNTSATDVLTVGTSAGTLMLTDASTGATFSFTADAPAALSAGIPIQVCTSAAVNIYLDGTNGSTAPSGGIAPYTYQWYASTTSNFTPGGGNILTGKTSQNLSVSGPNTALTFYKCIVTDSQGTPAIATTVEAPGRLLDVDLNVAFLGDSLYYNTPTSGNPPPTNWDQFSVYLGGRIHTVNFFNGGAPGSQTSDWLPTASAWGSGPPNTGSQNLITWFEAQIVGYTTVVIRLGANDGIHAVSASTYHSNLSTIVTHLLANVTGLQRVILNYPTYGKPIGSYGGAVNAFFQSYQAQIDSLVNGTTILQGDKKLWDASAVLTGWRQDDIHPSAEGSRELAMADIISVANALYQSSVSSVGGDDGSCILGPMAWW